MGWPRSFIDEVRRGVDAVRLVGEVVALKKRGSRWVGLCPFHQEKSPSFGVNDEGLWYCFGCGEGGDVFKFLMQYEGLDFAQAVRGVAERAGIQVPEPQRSSRAERRGPGIDRERLITVTRAAAAHYRARLQGAEGERARAYLDGRNLSPEVIDAFGLGYAPAGWEGLVRALGKEGFSAVELEAAGLAKSREEGSSHYDLLRDRIVFPIRDARGRPIAFGGRVLGDGEPKYLNTPETRLFNKSRTLYGLDAARESVRSTGFVMLVEGYLDLLACVQHGFTNVVAPLGTAFTAEHAKVLSSHARKAVVAFDGDEAGGAAAERTVGVFLPAGFQVSVLELPAGLDPDSFLAEHGTQGLKDALRESLPALNFLVARAGQRADLRTPQGKAQALASLLAFVLDVDDRVERAEWVGRIADALRIDEHLVRRSFTELWQRRSGAPPRRDQPHVERASERLAEAPLAERELLRAVLASPGWLAELEGLYGAGSLRDARVEGLLRAIAEAGPAGDGSVTDLLAACEVPGADALLSRVIAEGADEEPLDLDAARACALGVRRDALRSELADLKASIAEAERAGNADLDELQQRHLALGREIADLRRRRDEILAS